MPAQGVETGNFNCKVGPAGVLKPGLDPLSGVSLETGSGPSRATRPEVFVDLGELEAHSQNPNVAIGGGKMDTEMDGGVPEEGRATVLFES